MSTTKKFVKPASNYLDEKRIGIIIYYYKYNEGYGKCYCIFTFDPKYQKFVRSIYNVFSKYHIHPDDHELLEEKEEIVKIKIVHNYELDIISSTLAIVNTYEPPITSLNDFFELIDPKDELSNYNFENVVKCDIKNSLSKISDLNEKRLIDFKI